MDEIDAALDFKNVSIVANYIKVSTANGKLIYLSWKRSFIFELQYCLSYKQPLQNCYIPYRQKLRRQKFSSLFADEVFTDKVSFIVSSR